MLYPRVKWQYNISTTVGIQGRPTLCVGPNGYVYFAIAAQGDVGGAVTANTVSIVVGCLDAEGGLVWLLQDPRLVSSATDTQPTLAIGKANDLYVAFTTTGAVPTATNQRDVFSFCGSCGSPASGDEDVVVAKLTEADTVTPVVAWVVQDANLNTCNRESSPSLVYDIYADRLLIVYLSTGATLCQVPVGTLNIVLACLSIQTGGLVWCVQNDLLNSTGQNRNPSLTYDPSGAVYVAYDVTARVSGGGTLRGERDVEVVRINPGQSDCGLWVTRGWVLSASATVNAAGAGVQNVQPSIAYDAVHDRLVLTFCTTGTVPGGTKTAAMVDPVFVALSREGHLLWLRQSGMYNEPPYRFLSVDNPVLQVDVSGGSAYVTFHGYDTSQRNMILMYRLDPVTGDSEWLYKTPPPSHDVWRAYLPAAGFETPFSANTSIVTFSESVLCVLGDSLYVSYNDLDNLYCSVISLNQIHPYADLTAFEYMNQKTPICLIPVDLESLSAQITALDNVVNAIRLSYTIIDPSGNEVLYTILNGSYPLQERIDNLDNFINILMQSYVILDSEGNHIQMDSWATPQEHLAALRRMLNIFLCTYILLDPEGNIITINSENTNCGTAQEYIAFSAEVSEVANVAVGINASYVVMDAFGAIIELTIPSSSNPIDVRIAGLSRFLNILMQTYVILDSQGNRVQLDPWTTPQEHLAALRRLLTIFLSTYVLLDPSGNIVTLDV